MLRKIMMQLGFILLLCSIIPIQSIQASGSITVKVTPGYDGSVKPGTPFPIDVTVTNQGDDFVGELSILFAPSVFSGGHLVVPVNLPQNSEKKWSLYHPGIHTNFSYEFSQKTTVELFEGSVENGKSVKFEGDSSFSVRLLQEGQQAIGVITTNPDILNAYRSGQYNFVNPHVFQLAEEAFPDQAFSLKMIDLLVLDNAHIDEWGQDQQEALISFVKLGGKVLISNSTEQGSHLGVLQEYVPFKESNQVEGTNLQFLSKEESLATELYVGTISEEAEVLAIDGTQPLLAHNNVGLGGIYQTSFQLDDTNITQHSNYGKWIASQVQPAGASPRYHGMDSIEQSYHMFGRTGELFEKGNFSFPFIAFLVVFYVLILLPFIYFILKKLDKREQAWWIIPTVSIVSSIAIFIAGAYDRIGKPTMNELGIYILDEEQGAVGVTSQTLLSNKQGKFTVTFSEPYYSPMPITADYTNEIESVKGNAYTLLSTPKKEVMYPSINFWSTQTSLGPIYKENVGEIRADLTYENGKLTGTVENKLSASIKELWVAAGTEMIHLGSIDQNEKIKVDVGVPNVLFTKPTQYALHQYGYRRGPQEELEEVQKSTLFEYFTNSYLNQLPDAPLLIAISDSPFIVSQVKGGATRKAMNFFAKPVMIKADYTGSFEITKDNMEVEFLPINGSSVMNRMEVTEHEAFVGIGEYQLTYQIPTFIRESNFSLSDGNINYFREPGIEISLLNVHTGEFETMDSPQNTITLGEKVNQYIDQHGKITFKFLKTEDYGNVIPFPGIVLKGDITND